MQVKRQERFTTSIHKDRDHIKKEIGKKK